MPGRYRSLFADRTFRRLLPVFALSDLGDGMTVVAVAWLALALGAQGGQGALIGIAVAAYILPGALGAFVLGRWLRRLPARRLLICDSALRAGLLGAIPAAHAIGALTPAVYVGLLGASSLLHAWGKAGKHALFAPLLADEQRLAANSVLSTSMWCATIAGPALAGLLVGVMSPAWIIGLDAATFAVLALQTARTRLPAASLPLAGRDGLGILRRQPDLLALLVVTWLFNLAFGPVEVALPLFVTGELHAGAGLLSTYWAVFGIGAVIGALALGVASRLPLWPAMLAIIAGHGLGLLPFAATHTAVPSLIGFAFAGLVYGPYSALSFTLAPGPRTARRTDHRPGRPQRRAAHGLPARGGLRRVAHRCDQRARRPDGLRRADAADRRRRCGRTAVPRDRGFIPSARCARALLRSPLTLRRARRLHRGRRPRGHS